MKEKELLISIIEKEVGPLIHDHALVYGDNQFFTMEFLHKNKITLTILLIEVKRNHWVIHHDFSKETPTLIKKLAAVCERMERITEGKSKTFTLSEDLKEAQQRKLFSIAIKCALQNYLNSHFTLFQPNSPIVQVSLTKKADAKGH